MHTTKHLNGTKMRGYSLLLLFILSILISQSCESELHRPDIYQVIIQNNYFENLYNVKFGKYEIAMLGVKEKSDTLIFEQGNYDFSCLTTSDLTFKNNVKIQGYKEILHLNIKEKGKISIE